MHLAGHVPLRRMQCLGHRGIWMNQRPSVPWSLVRSNTTSIARRRIVTVLGIETSCDDTACGIVDSSGTVLGQSKLSHSELVKQWGGVFPSHMAQAHKLAVEEQVWNALRRWHIGDRDNVSGINSSSGSNCDMTTSEMDAQVAQRIKEEIDVVAVTCGPGLPPCLAAGTAFARGFAAEFGKPLLPVHHLEAHLLTFRMLDQQLSQCTTPFPFLVLLVSGGHCMLVLARQYRDYEILSQTVDDSVGEAYDKVARMLALDLKNGGGVELEKHATLFRESYLPHRTQQGTSDNDMGQDRPLISFPVPMPRSTNFSFSGLKTAVLRKVRELEWKSQNKDDDAQISIGGVDRLIRGRNGKHATFLPVKLTSEIAYAFQEAALQQLIRKTVATIHNLKASEDDTLQNLNTLVIAGGVAANEQLREKLLAACDEMDYSVKFPPIQLCTDNGVMVAWAGVEHINHCGGMDNAEQLIHDPDQLDIKKGWTLDILK